MFSLAIPATPRPEIPPATQNRVVHLVQPIDGDLPGLIRIRCGGVLTDYQIDPVFTHPDFRGQSWKLTKCSIDEEETIYHVLLSEQGHACECMGFLRHDRCKHVEALLALVQAGQV